jgi:hypothetical protein
MLKPKINFCRFSFKEDVFAVLGIYAGKLIIPNISVWKDLLPTVQIAMSIVTIQVPAFSIRKKKQGRGNNVPV